MTVPTPGLDPETPNVARAYNFLLDGQENFPADRELAARVLATLPEVKQMAHENRALLRRMVTSLAHAGVTRFLDIGAGLPCEGQVHEVAQQVNPDVHVVYVDYDPVVFLHSQVMLLEHPQVTIVTGDVRDPGSILGAPEVAALLEPGEPVALLLFAIMQWVVDDATAYGSVARLVDALPPASYVGLSHPTADVRPDRVHRIAELYKNTADVKPRSRAEIGRFFTGLEMVGPGLVPVAEWEPDVPGTRDDNGWNLAALAVKRP
jgi:hypothetical protein